MLSGNNYNLYDMICKAHNFKPLAIISSPCYHTSMVDSRALQKHSLFGGLETDQIDSILHLMCEEVYGPNESIISEGEPNGKIFFIIEGKVSVNRGDVLLSHFGEGEAFGEMEVLDVMPAAATIKCLTPVKLMSLSNKALREVYRLDLKIFSLIIMNLARDVCRRLRRMDEKMSDLPSTPSFLK